MAHVSAIITQPSKKIISVQKVDDFLKFSLITAFYSY